MKRLFSLGFALVVLVLLAGYAGGAARAIPDGVGGDDEDSTIVESGAADLGRINLGIFLTECPQAGKGLDEQPKPLDRRVKDAVEKRSNGGDDRRANQDFSCFPQDETSISINPTHEKAVVAGANDYRFGFGSSGFYASTDGGKHWYDGLIPSPSVGGAVSLGGYIPSGGDPAVVHDRDGVAYYAQLGFLPDNDTNGVFVARSSNGGFTWSRARVGGNNSQQDVCTTPPCNPTNDPRPPGDGVVQFDQDDNNLPDASIPFNDKEYIAAGPRPAGVQPQCFTPAHAAAPCPSGRPISSDRLYVTWTRFNFEPAGVQQSSQINVSYSDDQGRSWSPRQVINGSAAFCTGASAGGNQCDDNQGSSPTVNPATGALWVGFLNGDTPDEDQYLVVRSNDGGQTFTGPRFVTPIYDINYPRACSPSGTGSCTRPDCSARNAQRRNTLTNSCFRMNSYANIVADRRGGAFSDDLYALVDDNRNGTPASSNVDVFIFRSTDGGLTWIGPTRVNNDRSVAPPNRDCGRNEGSLPRGDVNTPCGGVRDFGNDQFYPWVDINSKGNLAVGFFDRRLDTNSTAAEWPTSRQRPGNYLSWYFAATCAITTTATVPGPATAPPAGAKQCTANQTGIIRQPTGPVNPGAGHVPGQNQTGLPFANFQLSDVPFNLDYAFPRGVFIGDYSNMSMADFGGKDDDAFAIWTDSRNGRSSGGPAGGTVAPSEPGRNPICEQSDVFVDSFKPKGDKKDEGEDKQPKVSKSDADFLVTPCPPQAQDKTDKDKGKDK